jgi:SAM-dependent methyltransferase
MNASQEQGPIQGRSGRRTGRRRAEDEHRSNTMDYDAELRLNNDVLRRAYALRRDDHVLDIGCGSGQTTREAARMASAGSAVGIDPSARMIDRARELTKTEGLHNVTFVHADAQVHPFPPERFDVAISRFGTMFFRDPEVAFTNIAGALRSAGGLVMMVWQAHERNEWSVEIEQSLAGDEGVTFTEVHEPVYYGPDVARALEWVRGFASTNEVLRSLKPASAKRSLDRLRETLAAHAGADGIWFDSRAWIVAARRR